MFYRKFHEFKNFKNVIPVTNGQKFQSGIPDRPLKAIPESLSQIGRKMWLRTSMGYDKCKTRW